MTYPEHDKLKKVQGNSQAIGEFLDWLVQEKRIFLATSIDGDFYPAHQNNIKLLAEYFDIDLTILEEEKSMMLQTIREAAQ